MKRTHGFTLIELLVVIAIIALLMAIIMPALNTAKKIATAAVCMGNQRSLITAWVMYADDNDGLLMCNGACYEEWNGPYEASPWVHAPIDPAGNALGSPPPASITNEDRFRGIRAGTMWPYVNDVGVYHCPGDNRRSKQPPRDCYRSYSISYAFGDLRAALPGERGDYRHYRRISDVKSATQYYVFIEEEHNGSRYGENEGGWHIPFSSGVNNIGNPGSWTFYDPLASYHNKSGTFGFADGHAERIKWRDKRTLQFIEQNANDPSDHSGIQLASPGNEDLQWLLEHFISQKRVGTSI
jgi:prepilin-type N-terminal cleavage/methylation domain-containing protein/prepilin-type processing-associated H-X9-DG protein